MFDSLPAVSAALIAWWHAVGPRLLGGVLVALLAWVLGHLARHLVVRVAQRAQHHRHLYLLIATTLKIVIWVVGAITALGTMGVNVSALVASLGLLGFSIGFALKDSLSNLMAGFMILLYEPFQVGDHIALKDHQGTVETIDLRYTQIRDVHRQVLIPNALLLNLPLIVTKPSEQP
jgi:small conductance mechanosensitive channel